MTESVLDLDECAAGRGDGRVLIAGVGNIFLSDDGFGVEVARRLARLGLPAHVEVADIGVRGVDLAYRLLDGYAACVLVDACARGGQPGTLYRIDASGARVDESAKAVGFDGHRMTPDAVFALLGTLSAGTGARPPEVIEVVGCEPGDVEEGMGLSAAVAAAVPEAVELVLRVIDDHRANRGHDHTNDPARHASAPDQTGAH
jgi:hydrogenase maturation protease